MSGLVQLFVRALFYGSAVVVLLGGAALLANLVSGGGW